jgi:hypothetical protein
MSYPYRVVVTRSVNETVKGSDKSSNAISLTPICPEGRMKDLLRQALEKRGFVAQPDGTLVRTKDGVTETFDPATSTITATAEATGEIKKEKTIEAHGDSMNTSTAERDRKHAESVAGERLEKQLAISETERKTKADELTAEARKRLADSEAARVRDLNEATLDVYAEAIKEKARAMGEVKEIRETKKDNATGGTEYELVIRVGEN